MITVSFNCPFCGIEIECNAERLSPEAKIVCHCGELIPAGVFYDSAAASEQTSSLV